MPLKVSTLQLISIEIKKKIHLADTWDLSTLVWSYSKLEFIN